MIILASQASAVGTVSGTGVVIIAAILFLMGSGRNR